MSGRNFFEQVLLNPSLTCLFGQMAHLVVRSYYLVLVSNATRQRLFQR